MMFVGALLQENQTGFLQKILDFSRFLRIIKPFDDCRIMSKTEEKEKCLLN